MQQSITSPKDSPSSLSPKTITVAEFFAGVGGFSTGLESIAPQMFSTVFANDVDSKCALTFNVNRSDNLTMRVDDIHNLSPADVPPADLYVAGFPCQPFSVAGLQMGFDDPRSSALLKLLELIEINRPSMLLFENVKNLLSHDHGRSLKGIVQMLMDRGYSVAYHVLDTAKITPFPQHRERLFIVGALDRDFIERFQFPLESDDKQERFTVRELLTREPAPTKYTYPESRSCYNVLRENIIEPYVVYQLRRVYVRKNQSGQCPTLTANMGTGGNNVPIICDDHGTIRKFTPRECFRLQGFPESFKFPPKTSDTQLYKQAGNAVSVPVIRAIGQCLLDARE